MYPSVPLGVSMMLRYRRKTVFERATMSFAYPRFLVVVLGMAVAAVSSASAQADLVPPVTTLEAVTSSIPLRDGIELEAGSAILRITAVRDDIVRLRISPGALSEDASWAVLPGPRSKSIDVQPLQDSASAGFRTAKLEVRVERSPLRVVIRDLAGNVISAEWDPLESTCRHASLSIL